MQPVRFGAEKESATILGNESQFPALWKKVNVQFPEVDGEDNSDKQMHSAVIGRNGRS